MVHLYEILMQENQKISFEYFEKIMNNIYTFLIEYDKFKNDDYHKIYYYSYMRKFKYSQVYIAKNLGMDQSTISRKQTDIRKYIILKINEVK